MTDRMADNIQWFLDRWDDPPTKLHKGGIEPDSQLGTPATSSAFAEWLYRSASAVIQSEETQPCFHVARDVMGSCAVCTVFDEAGQPLYESGTRKVTVTRWRWPMRSTIARLNGLPVPSGYPPLGSVLWQLAVGGGVVSRIVEVMSVKYPAMASEARARKHVVRALSEARKRYELGPRLPRVERSEAQRDAEAAA